MLRANAGGRSQGRRATDDATIRTVMVAGPDKLVKLALAYPQSTGSNLDDILRAIESLQLTGQRKLATPANWQPGDKAIIVPAVSDEQAKEMFPQGWDAKKPYLRYVEVK